MTTTKNIRADLHNLGQLIKHLQELEKKCGSEIYVTYFDSAKGQDIESVYIEYNDGKNKATQEDIAFILG